MTTTSELRSFAITLAIAFTIVGPEASGFAIHRTNSTPTTPSTNLSADENIRLQVRDDLKRPNDITSKNGNADRTTNSNKPNKANGKVSETEKTSNSTQIRTAIRTTTESNKMPTISSDTVEVFDSIEDTSFYNKTEINNSKGSLNFKGSELNPTEESVVNQTSAMITSFDKTQPSSVFVTIVDHTATRLDDPGENRTREAVTKSFQDNYETTQPYDKTEIPTTTETVTEILTVKALDGTNLNKTTISSISTDLPEKDSKNISNISTSNNDATIISTESSNISNLDVAQTTDVVNTKITDISFGKYPKYTTIIRKPTTVFGETTVPSNTEDDYMKAETSNTQVNFEKVFDVTPIPSLEKLRADLLSNTNKPLITSEISEGNEKVTKKVEITTPYIIESTETKRLGTVETKRAGYLDNSEKLTSPVTASVSEEIKENLTETYRTLEDKAAISTGNPDQKNVSNSESIRQLAEDELQEEFLKEEVLNNYKENAIRYHDERIGMEVVKLDNTSVLAGTGTEDSLSVQPIERTKTTLYTISPNYKPMKKIDVQPAKLFVRDPDDNSWRNESISSLGIVFKPKNSSKSFKEVLKNKTQTELNSLIERTKDDVPDLRVRLEKIAEVRKTKKKKMNKDGEIVYTDYEENSAETSNTTKPEPNPTILNSAEAVKMLTPSNFDAELSTKIELDVTTPMTTSNNTEGSKEKHVEILDIFSRLGLDLLTTQKPKKFFNMAEYYDSTDEYDADYVTMSKLDLKKFTTPPRTTPPAPLFTELKETYIPERKPTIQYFPPRESVNVNNVDKDFERKINLFTFKDHPRIEPHPPFVTVPPLTIATMKPEEFRPVLPVRPPNVRTVKPNMRSTVKPTDLLLPPDLNKNYYLTNAPPTTESEAFLINSGRVDRGSYVIKHYKDFLNAAVDDVERGSDFLSYHTTEAPRETFATEVGKTFRPRDDEEDYDTRFRKEVLTHFVDNFNQNSEQFKVDFPILYNNSIVHRKGEGSPASSRTFLKRLYHEGVATKADGLIRKPCEPNCELTVELSPAYELHYYVPNQEEREVQLPRTSPAPFRYGL